MFFFLLFTEWFACAMILSGTWNATFLYKLEYYPSLDTLWDLYSLNIHNTTFGNYRLAVRVSMQSNQISQAGILGSNNPYNTTLCAGPYDSSAPANWNSQVRRKDTELAEEVSTPAPHLKKLCLFLCSKKQLSFCTLP